jgi:hypothetical protein
MTVVRRVQYLPVDTLPGGPTPPTQVTPVALGDVLLESVDVMVPDGHAGTTQLWIVLAGVTIVPWELSTGPLAGMAAIVGNNVTFHFDVGIEVDQGLEVMTINSDLNPHTHYLRFDYTPISLRSEVPSLVQVPISQAGP